MFWALVTTKILSLLALVAFHSWVSVVLHGASAIDPLMSQCLKECNGAKEVIKKHLVILLLYVITETQYYVSRHSQTDKSALTLQMGPDMLQICTCIQRILFSPTLSHHRVWAFWGCTAWETGGSCKESYVHLLIENFQDRLLDRRKVSLSASKTGLSLKNLSALPRSCEKLSRKWM